MLVSLHTETAYAFNGATLRLEKWVEEAKKRGYQSLVLSEPKMHAALRFYDLCKAQKIQPILGLSITCETGLNHRFNVLAFAQNHQGYQTLLVLSSLKSVDQILSIETLRYHQEHLTFVLMPYALDMPKIIKKDTLFQTLVEHLDTQFDSFYVGNHPHISTPETSALTLPIDYVRMFDDSELDASKVLHQIFGLPEPILMNTSFKDLSYFEQNFDDEILNNLTQFIDKHTLTIEYQKTPLPEYKTPNNVSQKRYLEALSHKGLERRLLGKSVVLKIYQERLSKELETIHNLGYDDYFLIVYDVIRYARQKGYLVGPGRGSAPGSLVAYVLGITSVDPIEHQLLFERFLNASRQTMPDIDMDFPDYAREHLIQYVAEKYGHDHVAMICTFGTFLVKSSLKDVARVLNIDKRYINEIMKKVDQHACIQDLIDNDLDVKNRMQQEESIALWLKVSATIEGLPKHVSTHAAGIILSAAPLYQYTALQPGLSGLYQTQYTQDDLEHLGLLKIDFLGLRNLTLIEQVIERITQHTGKTIDVYRLPLNNKRTFAYLSNHSTTGIFQLESRGMRQLIKRMKIEVFEDIVTVLALYRPGPMENIPVYLKRRHENIKIPVLSDQIIDILAPTQGILLYQEQIMAIATAFAGYTLIEADLLRRAVSKKDESVLQQERINFVYKSVANNQPETLAHKIYDYIVKFANYGFNRSHSVAYAMIAYWMAYLKANYPEYFIAVLMENALGSETSMREYTEEAAALNIVVKKPDINISRREFVLKDGNLYYPLIGISSLGKQTVEALLEIRETANFSDYVTFIKRTHHILNKRQLTRLILSGALDGFKYNRQTMVNNIDALMQYVTYEHALNIQEYVVTTSEEMSREKLKKGEIEALGFLLLEDVFKPYHEFIEKHQLKMPEALENAKVNQVVKMVGVLTEIKKITTKQNKNMAFLKFRGRAQTIDAVCFPEVYDKIKDSLAIEELYVIQGKASLRNNQKAIVVNEIYLMINLKD